MFVSWLVLTVPATAQELAITGSCPGHVQIEVTDATPNGPVGLFSGTLGERFTQPREPCLHSVLSIGDPVAIDFASADGSGTVTLSTRLQKSDCGLGIQAVDMTTCGASATVGLNPPLPGECFPGSGTIPIPLTSSVTHIQTVPPGTVTTSCATSEPFYFEFVYSLETPALRSLSIDEPGNVSTAISSECGDVRSELDCSIYDQDLEDVPEGTYYIYGASLLELEADLTVVGVIDGEGACDPASDLLVCDTGYVCDEVDRVCRALACSDGIDNDGDLLVDFPDEPGCTSADDGDEFDSCPGAGCPQCADGLDSDGDGFVNLDDPMCDTVSDDDEDCNVIATDTFGYTLCEDDWSEHKWKVDEVCPEPAGGLKYDFLGTHFDDGKAPLGFTMDFYGSAVTEVMLNAYGIVGMAPPFERGVPELECLPVPHGQDSLFVWRDANWNVTSEGVHVGFETMALPNGPAFVTRWVGPLWCTRDIDVRAVLHENGDIDVCYAVAEVDTGPDCEATYGFGSQASTGIQGPGQDDFLQYHCQYFGPDGFTPNVGALYDGLVLHYRHP